ICGSTEKKIHTRQQNLADFYCKLSKPPLTFPGHPPDFPRKHQTINRKRKAWQSANGYNLELIFVYAVRLIVSAYEKVRLFVLLDVGFRSENKACDPPKPDRYDIFLHESSFRLLLRLE